MTDFTDTIEATAESVEDLQTDLEAHLEDITGVELETDSPEIGADADGAYAKVWVEFPGVEDELESRLDMDVDRFEAKLVLEQPGDPE